MDRHEEGADVSYAAEDRLLSMFLGKVDQQAERLSEIGGPGVSGAQADIDFAADGVTKVDTAEKERLLKLTTSVREYWSEATWAYIRENFRGCIFASATMLEGGLKLKIHEEEQQDALDAFLDGRNETLGAVIEFHQEETGILQGEVLCDAHRVRSIRNDHIHLLREQDPTEELMRTERDEFVPLSEFDDPPVAVEDGFLSVSGGNPFVTGVDGTGIVYKYKGDAEQCLWGARSVLRDVFGVRS